MFSPGLHDDEQEQEQEQDGQEQDEQEQEGGENEFQNVVPDALVSVSTPTKTKKKRNAPSAPRKKSTKVASDAASSSSADVSASASASAHTKTNPKKAVARPPLTVGASKTLPSTALPIVKRKNRERVGVYPKAAFKTLLIAAEVVKKGGLEDLIIEMNLRDNEILSNILIPSIANMIACGRKTLLQEDFKMASDQLGVTFIASQV
jgi:hypothetical protein